MNDFDLIPAVNQPENIRVKLFRHQLASIYNMEKLEIDQLVETGNGVKETNLGVNADLTGYGKSLSMIGLITRDKMEWDLDVPYTREKITTEAGGLVRNREVLRYDKLPCTVILASTSIVTQWQKEMENTDLQVVVMENRKDIDNTDVENYDVIIVTTNMYNNLVTSYPNYVWKRFIFDEPGHVRVSGMKEIMAGFYWFLTATPEAIIPQHINCRGSFMKKIIGDGVYKFEEHFSDIIVKNDDNFAQASFNMPETIHHYHECYQPMLQAVSGLVKNTVSEMLAAGNIEGAIHSLGGKHTENIIDLVKKDKLQELSKVEISIQNCKKDAKKLKIALDHQSSIRRQLSELDHRFSIMLKDNCSICMEKLDTPVLEPSCQNLFCGECLLTWLQKSKGTCPICRAEIDTMDLVYMSRENTTPELTADATPAIDEKQHCTQLEHVLQIIQKNKAGKFLIFSAYDVTFSPICRLLKENDISFTQVKGARKSRQTNIEKFKHGDTQVIFLNSNFNGAGINLQEATDIILYHEMSTSTQNQIIGRANRIGRTKSLHVHHLQVHI